MCHTRYSCHRLPNAAAAGDCAADERVGTATFHDAAAGDCGTSWPSAYGDCGTPKRAGDAEEGVWAKNGDREGDAPTLRLPLPRRPDEEDDDDESGAVLAGRGGRVRCSAPDEVRGGRMAGTANAFCCG